MKFNKWDRFKKFCNENWDIVFLMICMVLFAIIFI